MTTVLALGAIGVLVLVHLFIGKLRFLDGTPRSIWLSIGGGVSVAYVFVHLLPELAEAQESLTEAAGDELRFLEQHVYLLALAGLATFYGLERAAITSRRHQRAHHDRDGASAGVFWLHAISFTAYNVLTGYLIHQRGEEGSAMALALFGIAMALHFVVNDFGVRDHYRGRYDRIGRWLFAAAIVLGWAVGFITSISEAAQAVLLAILGGGVILNVMKEELPEERESRFWAFTVGAAAYAALLLML